MVLLLWSWSLVTHASIAELRSNSSERSIFTIVDVDDDVEDERRRDDEDDDDENGPPDDFLINSISL